jgi:hypothetical protein
MSTIIILFTPDSNDTHRGVGYATVAYDSSATAERTAKLSMDALIGIFEQAQANGETLAGVDATLADAIANPLAYLDFLICDAVGEVGFDADYTRTSLARPNA